MPRESATEEMLHHVKKKNIYIYKQYALSCFPTWLKAPETAQRQAEDATSKIQILASLYWRKSPFISIGLILDWDLCVGIIPCQVPQRPIPIPMHLVV